jgi:spore coat protein U-like protein
MNKNFLISVAASLASAAAFAATNPATATFDVKLTVLKACSVLAGATSDIDFGSQDATAANVQNSNTISVTCSKKTPYTIGLTPGNNSTTGAGVMAAQNVAPVTGNNDTVAYQLRSTAGLTGTVWGDTNSDGATVGNGVSGTGNGAAQSHTVYATVPTMNVTPDAYKDTVKVTVRY